MVKVLRVYVILLFSNFLITESIETFYKTGELIRYENKDTPVIGLTTLTNYYVTAINGSSFKLSAVGVGSTPANFHFRNKEYVELLSGGSGINEFNYPPITISLEGHIGVSTLSGQNFNAS